MILGLHNFSFGLAQVQQIFRKGLIVPNSATEHHQTKCIYTKKGRKSHDFRPSYPLRGSNGFSRHRGSVAVATCGGAGVRPR